MVLVTTHETQRKEHTFEEGKNLLLAALDALLTALNDKGAGTRDEVELGLGDVLKEMQVSHLVADQSLLPNRERGETDTNLAASRVRVSWAGSRRSVT